MTHFICTYLGNKWKEMKNIDPFIPFDKILSGELTTIIEPFCGSSAMSFYIYKKIPEENINQYKFILNDFDKELFNLYMTFKIESIDDIILGINKELQKINLPSDIKNLRKRNDKNPYEYVAHMKSGIAQYFKKPNLITKLKDLQIEFINFIKRDNVIITNNDWLDCYNENYNNSIYLFDPPYVMGDNSYYKLDRNYNCDGCKNIYEYFYLKYDGNLNKIEDKKIIFVLEGVWFIRLLFKDNIKGEYNKTYSMTKKQTKHIFISNL